MPVTVAMGNAYYVLFMPMVIATRMRMPTVMSMPMTMCTGTYTIGKHASGPQLLARGPSGLLTCPSRPSGAQAKGLTHRTLTIYDACKKWGRTNGRTNGRKAKF